jgi:hypothetical protein
MYAHAGERKVDEQDDEGFDVLAENGGSSSFLSSVDMCYGHCSSIRTMAAISDSKAVRMVYLFEITTLFGIWKYLVCFLNHQPMHANSCVTCGSWWIDLGLCVSSD